LSKKAEKINVKVHKTPPRKPSVKTNNVFTTSFGFVCSNSSKKKEYENLDNKKLKDL
jgi:hypothetical protein